MFYSLCCKVAEDVELDYRKKTLSREAGQIRISFIAICVSLTAAVLVCIGLHMFNEVYEDTGLHWSGRHYEDLEAFVFCLLASAIFGVLASLGVRTVASGLASLWQSNLMQLSLAILLGLVLDCGFYIEYRFAEQLVHNQAIVELEDVQATTGCSILGCQDVACTCHSLFALTPPDWYSHAITGCLHSHSLTRLG